MVAAHALGAGPAAAANLVKLADTAFARVTGLVAELTKVFALAPDLREGHFAHIAAIQLQIPAGLHLAGMADEAETVPPRQPLVMASMPKVSGVTLRPSSCARWRMIR